MRNKVVPKGDIFGGAHVLDMVRAVLSPAAELARWDRLAFIGTTEPEALAGSIVKVEYVNPAGAWTEWLESVTVPIGFRVGLRCTVKNDMSVRAGLAIDFYYADPFDWAAGRYTRITTGAIVPLYAGKTLRSSEHIFNIDKVGNYKVV
ncbi:MAG: hypothetical protein ABIH46_08000, partial [Chloroflexota bacterium]